VIGVQLLSQAGEKVNQLRKTVIIEKLNQLFGREYDDVETFYWLWQENPGATELVMTGKNLEPEIFKPKNIEELERLVMEAKDRRLKVSEGDRGGYEARGAMLTMRGDEKEQLVDPTVARFLFTGDNGRQKFIQALKLALGIMEK